MSKDTKTSAEAFGFYRRWEKALLAYDTPLPKGCPKIGFVAYCFAMATHGTNGLDCFASDATLCDELGIYNRRDIAKYRKAATDRGWLIPSGKRHGRAVGLNIAIPSVVPPEETVSPKSDTPFDQPTGSSPKPDATRRDQQCPHTHKTYQGEIEGVPSGQCTDCGQFVTLG